MDQHHHQRKLSGTFTLVSPNNWVTTAARRRMANNNSSSSDNKVLQQQKNRRPFSIVRIFSDLQKDDHRLPREDDDDDHLLPLCWNNKLQEEEEELTLNKVVADSSAGNTFMSNNLIHCSLLTLSPSRGPRPPQPPPPPSSSSGGSSLAWAEDAVDVTSLLSARWAEVESVFSSGAADSHRPPLMSEQTYREVLQWRRLFQNNNNNADDSSNNKSSSLKVTNWLRDLQQKTQQDEEEDEDVLHELQRRPMTSQLNHLRVQRPISSKYFNRNKLTKRNE